MIKGMMLMREFSASGVFVMAFLFRKQFTQVLHGMHRLQKHGEQYRRR